MTTTPSAGSAPTPDRRLGKNEKRAVASGTLGSAFEYFDFTIFGALSATLFPSLFFSELGSSGALLASLATFGVGFAARPLGALVFGHFGDKFGRLPALYTTLLLMGVCTLAIGLLPTGQGIVVATILVILRFVQGFSLGGETSGNQLVVMEHGQAHRRGLLASFIIAGSPIAQVMANLLLAFLTSVLTDEQWQSWGWRIPFLSSIVIVLIAMFIRLRLEETPAFTAQKKAAGAALASGAAEKRESGAKVLLREPFKIIRLGSVLGGSAFSFHLVAVYGLSLLAKQYGMSTSTTFIILMVANALSIPLCILGGWISDRGGRKRPFFFGLAINVIGIVIFFVSAPTGSVGLAILGAGLALGGAQWASAIYPPLFAEQFPTEFRYSGSALSFGFCNLVYAAPAPFIAAALAEVGGTQAVLWLALGLMAVSFAAIASVREHNQVDLAAFSAAVAEEESTESAREAQPVPGPGGNATNRSTTTN
jgi:MFS family permease